MQRRKYKRNESRQRQTFSDQLILTSFCCRRCGITKHVFASVKPSHRLPALRCRVAALPCIVRQRLHRPPQPRQEKPQPAHHHQANKYQQERVPFSRTSRPLAGFQQLVHRPRRPHQVRAVPDLRIWRPLGEWSAAVLERRPPSGQLRELQQLVE